MTGFVRTTAVITDGIVRGDHLGAQVFVQRAGEVVLDTALGDDRPGVPLRTDTLLPWMSATKPLVAVAISRCWERGLLELDDPVARHVPEFGVHGKERLTIRHLLTHTGGFRLANVGDPTTPWDETLARIHRMRLEPRWVPGHKAGYHFHTSWFVLGEIVARSANRPFAEVLRDDVLRPLGLVDSWVGMPPTAHAEYGARIGRTWDTSGTEPVDRGYHSAAHCAWVVPGGGGRGPARELGRFYEMLRRGGTLDGARLLTPQTVAALTARHRVGLHDHTFGHVIDWGLGFLCDSKHTGDDATPYGYGSHASWRTYGHGGRECAVGCCDPEHELVIAVLFNGMPGEARHDTRLRAVMTAIYEDLGIGAV